MTTINPYYLSVDGHVIGTYADTIELVRGLKVLGGKRRQTRYAANRHGAVPSGHLYSEEKRLPIEITVAPFDEDGVYSNAHGPVGQLQENLDALFTILGKSGSIDLRHVLPLGDDTDSDSEALLETQATARIDRATAVQGDLGAWKFLVEFVLEWPFWHELPLISDASAGGTLDILTGGTAPIADMVFSFAGDGTLEYPDGGSILEIADSSGAVVVDVGRRTVTQAGLPARGLLRLGAGTPHHWMEWPPQTLVEMTCDVGVSVDYYNSRH